MRIQINISVAEHEIQLATELLNVLRSITDEVNIKTQHDVNGVAPGAEAKAGHAMSAFSVASNGSLPRHKALSLTAGAAAAHQKSDSDGSTQSGTSRASGPAASAASASTSVPPGFLPSPGQTVSGAAGAQGPKQAALPASMQPFFPGSAPGSQAGSWAGSLPSTAVAALAAPAHTEAEAEAKALKAAPVGEKAPGAKPKRASIVAALRKMIEGLDSDEDYDVKLDKVSSNLKTVFDNKHLGTEEEAFNTFWDAFKTILWDPERLAAQKSVVPIMNLLPRLPEYILARTKEPLIGQTMRRLTESRSVHADRNEFFTDAEIFACIIGLRLVGAAGVVKTIVTMLGTEPKRAAAMTMLGKTVERHSDQLLAEVDAEALESLKTAVASLKEPAFQYDKMYVYECMEWGSYSNAPAAPAKGKLYASTSYKGHAESVYTLAYDPVYNQLVSAGKDSCILLWDAHGNVAARLPSEQEGCYGGMAMHPSSPVFAAVCMGGLACPEVDVVNTGRGSLSRRQKLRRASSELVSCATCLPGSDLFAIGELNKGDGQSLVSIFDFNAVSSCSEPVTTLKEEHGTVTCVGPLHTGQPNPNMMLSGTKDGTIMVWDIRQQKAAVHMHVEEAGAEGEPMVTTFDSHDCVIMAGSVNGYICRWDARKFSSAFYPDALAPQESMVLDNSAILRVAFGPAAPQAAVSTLAGLYYMDPFAEGDLPSNRQAVPFADRATPQYPDVKWGKGPNADVLYAAALDCAVDVYRLG